MTHFRKRFNAEIMAEINEMLFLTTQEPEKKDDGDPPSDSGTGNGNGSVPDDDLPEPKGNLILDATCTPADIHYPTDITLLNDARELLETVIDELHLPFVGESRKPRDYREQARKHFLSFTKTRRPSYKRIKATIRRQLGYVGRDLKSIAKMLDYSNLELLDRVLYKKLMVVSELYRQQRLMYQQQIHKVEDRIVSIHQPHIRPIARGKAGPDVEFGAKVLISVYKGFSHVEKMDYNNFNEGQYLIQSVEAYKARYGYYPARILADKLLRTRENYRFCKANNIHVSNFRLGRPPKNLTQSQITEERIEEGLRNEVEGKFGTGKRKYTLNRILTRLPETTATQVVLAFLVMNLDKLYRDFLYSFFKVLFFHLFRRISWPLFTGRFNVEIIQ
jgi:IS5 family transposase